MEPRPQDQTTTRSDKRPYEPPRIQSEPIFETTALACGKVAAGAKCSSAPGTS